MACEQEGVACEQEGVVCEQGGKVRVMQGKGLGVDLDTADRVIPLPQIPHTIILNTAATGGV